MFSCDKRALTSARERLMAPFGATARNMRPQTNSGLATTDVPHYRLGIRHVIVILDPRRGDG